MFLLFCKKCLWQWFATNKPKDWKKSFKLKILCTGSSEITVTKGSRAEFKCFDEELSIAEYETGGWLCIIKFDGEAIFRVKREVSLKK